MGFDEYIYIYIKEKVDTPDESLVRILDAAVSIKIYKNINSDHQHSIFSQEFLSALRLAVGIFEHLL